MEPGSKILANNYELRERLTASADHELWTALDIFSGPALVKIWPFGGSRPDDTLRAAWNQELRNLLRLSSSPDAESRMLVVRRAGIDYVNRSFVLVMASPGTTPLDKTLRDRQHIYWFKNINENRPRAALWRGIRSVCLGLQQLHQYQMLHRNVVPSSVFVDEDEGPESMRLGGFEWTIRLGETIDNTLFANVQASDVTSLPHSFESDWLAFALLVATILIPSQDFYSPSADLSELSSHIQGTDLLNASEKHLLSRMLDPSPIARLSRPLDIVRRMDDIISVLDRTPRLLPSAYLGLVVLLGPARDLTRSIIESDPHISALDIDAQRRFIEHDLSDVKIVNSTHESGRRYILIGNRLSYLIREHQDQRVSAVGHWNLAFCNRDTAVRFIPDNDVRELPAGLVIRVFTTASAKEGVSLLRRDAISWNYFLPVVERRSIARERQRRFHDFFRITNQIELLFCDAELYPYVVVSRSVDGENDLIEIREGERQRDCLAYAQPRDGLLGFLETESAVEDKRGADLVYLGPEESLMIDPIPEAYYWKIRKLDQQTKIVHLSRPRQTLAVPTQGFVRTYGMFGQVSLIKRRKQAIDRLQYHNYLLEALQNPYFCYVDTGDTHLPVSIDPDKVDAAKMLALKQLWKTRPIYALQGPPGTGKTTLVANLLGLIFEEDPVAQVLVSAQAHAAVDVLREKVNDEIFKHVAEDQRPMSIRLPKGKKDFQDNDPDSLNMVTLRLLERSEMMIQSDDPISREWHEVVHEAIMGLKRADLEGSAGAIRELVRRSASITYSTTTGGSLEELANMTQTYDWSLIEEAGKAHGFDLALPLQTGHRWLLIGDQNQLSAYKYDNFQKALTGLQNSIDLLMALPERARGLVDMELLQNWNARTSLEQTDIRNLWVSWLPTFKRLFENCQLQQSSTRIEPTTPLSNMLSQQHRMHPTIGNLISHVYYNGTLESKATDKAHLFTTPQQINGKALVWLNIGSIPSDDFDDTAGLYTSGPEVMAIKKFVHCLRVSETPPRLYKLALLSPYRLQVHRLAVGLKEIYDYPPGWLAPLPAGDTLAHTVDSFQGDQADVVCVSLVRNNQHRQPKKALGFLEENSRMNVLLSRAERLLVLVGNWEFFKDILRDVPADTYQPFGHLKCTMNYFEQGFKSGYAAMIDARDLEATR